MGQHKGGASYYHWCTISRTRQQEQDAVPALQRQQRQSYPAASSGQGDVTEDHPYLVVFFPPCSLLFAADPATGGH